jgi:hypothetical protein
MGGSEFAVDTGPGPLRNRDIDADRAGRLRRALRSAAPVFLAEVLSPSIEIDFGGKAAECLRSDVGLSQARARDC